MIIICVQRRHTTRHEFISKTHSQPDNCHWNIYQFFVSFSLSLSLCKWQLSPFKTHKQNKKTIIIVFLTLLLLKNFPKCLVI